MIWVIVIVSLYTALLFLSSRPASAFEFDIVEHKRMLADHAALTRQANVKWCAEMMAYRNREKP